MGTTSRIGEGIATTIGCLFQAALGLVCFGGWLTHLYVCFNGNRWGFLIAGAICFPIAVIHGWGLWLGWWR